ncbi:hypothetical protein [Sporosarcina sp.]|nr:hypothetical protein [Sporosarcina sp.]
MFSTQWSVHEIAKRQFLFKINANAPIFTMLIVLQIIATVFMGGASTSGYESWDDPFSFTYTTVSNDGQIGLTMFWALIVGFLLTSAAQRNESFAFVTNRLTYQLANFYFFCTAALLGGVTTVMLGSVMKIITLVVSKGVIETAGLFSAPGDFFAQIFVMTAYTLLLMLVGYTIGIFIQLSRLFIMLFALIWMAFTQFSFFMLSADDGGLLHFFYGETSILLFTIKVLVAAAALFGISFWVTNRLEVRNP